MKYFLIAGEPSGDNHGAALINQIRSQDPTAVFNFVGGGSMTHVADGKVLDISEFSVMGFTEVLVKLPHILRKAKFIKSCITSFNPDVVVFIDYPGLNLRLAKWVKEKGFKTTYYILPKAWAWNKKRVKSIKKYIDLSLSILPFEADFFSKHEVEALYVGNPSQEAVSSFVPNQKFKLEKNIDKPILAILPGSRAQEINRILPILIRSASKFDNYQIVVSKAKHLALEMYDKHLSDKVILTEDYYNLLYHSDIALVTSGTATLEAALFGVPQVVCYKTSNLNYMIAKRLVKLPYISLVNLIAGKGLVAELIQEDCSDVKLDMEIKRLFYQTEKDKQAFYTEFKDKLGSDKCSKKAAQSIINLINI